MLLRGPSGAGKSDLALQAVQAGWRLVADDRTTVWRSGERAFGRAPAALEGLMEARGHAILRLPPLVCAPLAMVVDLLAPGADLERLPEPQTDEIAGLPLPRVTLRGGEPSTLARLALALQAHGPPAAKAPL